MAENLNYETAHSSCHEDSTKYCTKYGRRYPWYEAVGKDWITCGNSSCDFEIGDVRGVCPKGWHLPSGAEWNALISAVGGSSTAGIKLKSASGWSGGWSGADGNGVDAYSFSVLPAGGLGGSVCRVGECAAFWSTASVKGSTAKYTMALYHDNDAAELGTTSNIGGELSVRCLKD